MRRFVSLFWIFGALLATTWAPRPTALAGVEQNEIGPPTQYVFHFVNQSDEMPPAPEPETQDRSGRKSVGDAKQKQSPNPATDAAPPDEQKPKDEQKPPDEAPPTNQNESPGGANESHAAGKLPPAPEPQASGTAQSTPDKPTPGKPAPNQASPAEVAQPQPPQEIVLRDYLITKVARGGRTAIHRDWVEEQIVRGQWKPPKAGESVKLPSGETRTWQAITADDKGVLNIPRERKHSYYAAATVEEPEAGVWLLAAQGHSMVYVNGVPRTGDPFNTGWVRTPIWLHKGENHLLFHVGGSLSARLVPPEAPVVFELGDTTLPDLLVGESGPWWGAVVVANAQNEPATGLYLVAEANGFETTRVGLDKLAPLAVQKVPFHLEGEPPVASDRVQVRLRLVRGGASQPPEGSKEGAEPEEAQEPERTEKSKQRRTPTQANAASAESEYNVSSELESTAGTESESTAGAEVTTSAGVETVAAGANAENASNVAAETTLAEAHVELDVRVPTDLHKRTFLSEIDGSVQYFMARPAKDYDAASDENGDTRDKPDSADKPGMIFTLHGAAVEASRHIRYVAAKEWAHVIAPTNRRPYGFDWEDWGRLDALEVLREARRLFPTNPRRVYLAGHSMGGHGAWQIASLYPDRFAATGPSAGWISLFSYGGMPRGDKENPIEAMLTRAAAPSDTLRMVHNLGQLGVYVLHGAEDKNVPVEQSRIMRAALGEFHTDFAYHEQPGAGHWWGAAAVDSQEMMRFFENRKRPDGSEINEIDFTTVNPGVSARSAWVMIEAQEKQLEPSRVTIRRDKEKRRIVGKTENVTRLMLSLGDFEPAKPFEIELDGQRLRNIRATSSESQLWLARRRGVWLPTGKSPPKEQKGPHRYGTLKDAFRNRPILVYSTQGAEEEDAWSLAKARFDAESFWYRGNGSFDVVADVDFDPAAEKDRNVVLYGNADTNGAWGALLSTSPVQVRHGRVSVGQRPEMGADLACLFVRPRVGSDTATVAVIGGTGLPGMRLCDRMRYFVSGVAYPDLTLFSVDSLHAGTGEVRAVGFFGLDWEVESGKFEWRDAAL